MHQPYTHSPLHTHTHTHIPACKRLQTRTTGMDPSTEDTWFLIHHYSTVDITWLFTTQPRTSSYTSNKGHGLNSIFTSFLSSCTPPLQTEDHPRCGMCPRAFVKFHVCVLVWRHWQTHPNSCFNSHFIEQWLHGDYSSSHYHEHVTTWWLPLWRCIHHTSVQRDTDYWTITALHHRPSRQDGHPQQNTKETW